MSDKPKKMNFNSMDISEEKRKKLKELFPEVFNEEHIDFNQFKRVLGEWIEPKQERFGLNWPGKAECMKVIQAPAKGTLKPCKEESINWDTTENLFIEGDNLEILKLLQKAYFGKIKMIYIDPPYNTGKEFIYPDKYSEGLDTYLRYTGQKDSNGHKFSTNSDTNGRFHSRWLNMMYPRLYLAKNLLREDGAIFISIDDNEQANLKKLCDEIFGEENFFSAVIIRSNSRGQTYKQIAKTHEYILVYTKDSMTELFELEKDANSNDLDLTDEIGAFSVRELRNRNPKFGKHNRPNLFYPIYVDPNTKDADGFFKLSLTNEDGYAKEVLPFNSQGKESCWRWGKERCLFNIKERSEISNLVGKKKTDGSFGIYEKYRKTTYKPKSIWTDNSFLTETGTVVTKGLGLEGTFDFAKPPALIRECIELSTKNDDIILDFFAGSGTTAEAVLQRNQEDGGHRKYICVQLPEPLQKDTYAHKNGYKTVADIGKERIRRVIKQFEDKSPNPESLDLGFKVLKLDKSCFKEWNGNPNISQQMLLKQIEEQIDYIDPKALDEDILYELILKDGLSPTTPIKKLSILGKTVYSIQKGALLICLDRELTEDFILKLVETEPTPKRVICLDAGFRNNDQLKTNAVHTFKTRAHHKETTIDFFTV